ncbi:MAG: type II toxin-antitoxin system Phd/YefM family antitoxin [Armatimonadetes bacterium]|nr:type II toxin-antitoxin system Phd/YefM family antitoxin [Armatimonadota bacterium]
MERVVSATEARTQLGSLLRRVAEHQETVVVSRSGKPQAVIISAEHYQILKRALGGQRASEESLEQIARLGEEILRRRAEPLSPVEQILSEMRKERDAELGLP